MRYLSVCSGIEAATVAWQPIGWKPVAFSEVASFPCAVLAHHYPNVPNLGDMTKIEGGVIIVEQLTFLLAGLPVRTSALPESERDWLESAADWPLHISVFLKQYTPDGLSGRMSPVCCQSMAGGILEPSSGGWRNAGMGSPTEFLTLNTSEFPSAAVESSLSDILETGDLPPRYFLSRKACAGILLRAEKRGRTLPEPLRLALTAVAQEVDQKELPQVTSCRM